MSRRPLPQLRTSVVLLAGVMMLTACTGEDEPDLLAINRTDQTVEIYAVSIDTGDESLYIRVEPGRTATAGAGDGSCLRGARVARSQDGELIERIDNWCPHATGIIDGQPDE